MARRFNEQLTTKALDREQAVYLLRMWRRRSRLMSQHAGYGGAVLAQRDGAALAYHDACNDLRNELANCVYGNSGREFNRTQIFKARSADGARSSTSPSGDLHDEQSGSIPELRSRRGARTP